MYLRNELVKANDPRKDDEEFINDRTERAEIAYEEQRRSGLTENQAQEYAMSILTEGLE